MRLYHRLNHKSINNNARKQGTSGFLKCQDTLETFISFDQSANKECVNFKISGGTTQSTSRI